MSLEKSRMGLAAIALAFAAGCSYGVGGTISQIVKVQGFALNHIVLAQCLFAALILGVLVAVRFRPRMRLSEMLKLMGVGAFAIVSSYLYYYAIDLLSVGAAVAIQFQYVWIVIVISSVAERKLPSVWVIVATALIIAGTLLGSGVADEVLASGRLVMDPVGIV